MFEYLYQQLVNRHLVDTYGPANYELRVFQKAVNSVFGQRDFSAPNLFRTFHDKLYVTNGSVGLQLA